MEDDWDLHALVRSCTGTTTTTSSSASASAATTSDRRDFDFFSKYEDVVDFSDPLTEPRPSFAEELHELYKPFFPKSLSLSHNTLCFSGDIGSPAGALPATPVRFSVAATCTTAGKGSQGNRPKRRKNLVKKVKHVDAEELSSDVWSWRKYGQKPIKGSPYPRGYYRCSSSKGCLARKQVERNRSDPGKFIVTFTGDHSHPVPTHRNSLAGGSRRKLPASPTSAVESPQKPSSSGEEDLAVKIEMENLMDDDGDDGEFGLSDMTVGDDFFAGLEELTRPVSVDYLPDSFTGSFSLPWAATAGGGF